MKKNILIILFSIFLGINGVLANDNKLENVRCDSSFNDECGECGELILGKLGEIDKLNFSHSSNKREILYKEEQSKPYLTDGFGRKIKNFNNYNYPSYLSSLYDNEVEGFVLQKNKKTYIYEQLEPFNVYKKIGKNNFNGNILGFIKTIIYTHDFQYNNPTVETIERVSCVKILKNK